MLVKDTGWQVSASEPSVDGGAAGTYSVRTGSRSSSDVFVGDFCSGP